MTQQNLIQLASEWMQRAEVADPLGERWRERSRIWKACARELLAAISPTEFASLEQWEAFVKSRETK